MDILSPEAVTRLWDQHSAALLLYARQWCDAPEDIVQEAFLLLVRQAVRPANPLGWLYRVVRNRAINAGRSRRRQRNRETAAAASRETWFESSGSERLDAASATAALAQLPADQREAIVARIWGGLSFEEIARLTGSPLSAVYRGYQRGLLALRERLGATCPTKKIKTKI